MASLPFNIAQGAASLGVRTFLKCSKPQEFDLLKLHQLRSLKNLTDQIYQYDDGFGRGKQEAISILEEAIRIEEQVQPKLKIIKTQLKSKITEKIVFLQSSKLFILLLLFVVLIVFIFKMEELGTTKTTSNQQLIITINPVNWWVCFSAGFAVVYVIGTILFGSCCCCWKEGFINKTIAKISQERDKI